SAGFVHREPGGPPQADSGRSRARRIPGGQSLRPALLPELAWTERCRLRRSARNRPAEDQARVGDAAGRRRICAGIALPVLVRAAPASAITHLAVARSGAAPARLPEAAQQQPPALGTRAIRRARRGGNRPV